MNKAKENNKHIPEPYSLNYPSDMFRVFIRTNYVKEGELTNEQIDEVGKEFYRYLNDLNLTKEQRRNVLPKDLFDVMINSNQPFRVNGFPPGYLLHFSEYVKSQQSIINH